MPLNSGSHTRISPVHHTFLLAVLVLTAIPAWQLFATLPNQAVMMEQVTPPEVRPGGTATITGYALDPSHIAELYLIDDADVTYRTDIITASGTTLVFRVPVKIPAGMMRIAVKTPGRAGLTDQMVYLKILEPVG